MGRYKSYTDVPQSQNLVKILPLDSADMYWKNGVSNKYIQCFTPFVIDEERLNVDFDYDTPCWSLAALVNALPEIQGFKPIISLYYNYISYPHISDLYTNGDNLVDACYKMIIKLKERKGT